MRCSWPKSILALFLVLAGAIGVLYLYGALRWQRAARALHAKSWEGNALPDPPLRGSWGNPVSPPSCSCARLLCAMMVQSSAIRL